MLNLVGYRIQAQIYESRNSLVYRGVRSQDQYPVVLKQLKPEKCIPAHLACYRQEYAILRNLKLTGVIQAYGLEVYENSLVLILEDCGGKSLEQWLEVWQSTATELAIPLVDFLKIAIAMTESLSQLHAAQIIHKDIKPSNIIWNPTTQALRLIDFGIATLILDEDHPGRYPTHLEGTLAYLAPEQTGRLYQAVDQRSDLYALGVTFYELLTGQLPFEGRDANTIIQGHLTQPPIPPHLLKPQIPLALSQIVLRLMAKHPSHRYPSANDLRGDLITCLNCLQNNADIGDWGSPKPPEKFFHIPEKCYGREPEQVWILDWLNRTLDNQNPEGGCDLLLVTGKSGVGKTALIKAVQSEFSCPDTLSIQAQGNPWEQHLSLYWIKLALIDLIDQVNRQESQLRVRWRITILRNLGSQVMRLQRWLPELDAILADSGTIPSLANPIPQFGLAQLIVSLLASLAEIGVAVVFWGEDLQWADQSSLHLIQRLCCEPQAQNLVLIGVYCDNLVSPEHPLLDMVAQLRSIEIQPMNLLLQPLSVGALQEWVADALQTSSEPVPRLAGFIHEKSAGDLLFATQLLKQLHQQRWLSLKGQDWHVDLTQIQTISLPNNSLALFAQRLQELPGSIVELLQVAAQIGMTFDLETLHSKAESAGFKHDHLVIEDYLWQAIQSDIILPVASSIKEDTLSSSTARETTLFNVAEQNCSQYQFRHHLALQSVYGFPKVKVLARNLVC